MHKPLQWVENANEQSLSFPYGCYQLVLRAISESECDADGTYEKRENNVDCVVVFQQRGYKHGTLSGLPERKDRRSKYFSDLYRP